MFEFIGMIFVGLIVWSILKGFINGALRGTLSRAVDFAAVRGVPRPFSRKILESPDLIKVYRDKMVKCDPNFAALDVYEQYGRALIMMYEDDKF